MSFLEFEIQRLIRTQGYSGGDFTLQDNLSFCYQHDARIHAENGPSTLISLFNNDNSAVASGVNQSTSVFLTVNTDTMEATLVRELFDPSDPIFAVSQGNTEYLDDGHTIMGFGSAPILKEFDEDGRTVLTVQWGEPTLVQSYRDYKSVWVGKPSAAPNVFACREQGNTTTSVYMSWNGATEHQNWTILAGDSKDSLTRKTVVTKVGFETVAQVNSTTQFIQVEARGDGIDVGISEVTLVEDFC